MRITEIAVKRPITTAMFFLGVLMVGGISLSRLAVDLLPDLSYPQLTIWTRYQDVAPEEVENFITKPVESALSTVPGIKKISSVSQEGVSLVQIEFEWGTNMDYTTLSVREKLDKIRFDRFPDGASRPVIIRVDPSQQPILSLSVSGENLMQLKETCSAVIKRRLEQIEGVALATVTGGLDRELHVDVDIEKMLTLDVSLGDIKEALRSSNTTGSGGYIRRGEYRYSLRTLGEFLNVDELKAVVVGRQDNHPVFLKDIAIVLDTFKERDNITRFNGEESIGIIVQKEAGSNTVRVAEKVDIVISQLKDEFPQFGISVAISQADFISNSINNVLQTIVIGGILAFFVLFFFLHDLRNPFNIAIVIPIAIIATFSLLYFNNVSLNIMSLGGLALGVGMLVDNSIVVLENIFRHRQEGKGVIEATILGTKEISMAVSASTFTTISVFFPIIFVEGVAGQLFRDQALTITFSLICSLIVSLTLLPMMVSRFFRTGITGTKEQDISEQRPETAREHLIEPKKEKYQKAELSGIKKTIRNLLLPFKFLLVDIIYRYVIYYCLWKGLVYYFLWKFIVYLLFYRFFTILLLRPVYFTVLGLIKFWITGLSKLVNSMSVPVFHKFDSAFENFASWYERLLSKSLDNRGKTLLIISAAAVITLFLGTQLNRELIPQVDQRQFEVEILLPVGSSLEQTDMSVLKVTNWLLENPDVEAAFSSAGIIQEKGTQSVRSTSLNRGLILVRLKEKGQFSTEEVIQSIRDREGELIASSVNFSTGETTLKQVLGTETSDITLNISGEDYKLSGEIMSELLTELRKVEGLADIRTGFSEGKPEIRIEIDRDRADRYGISLTEIVDFISFSMKGETATQFKDFDRNIDIVVRPDMHYRDELEDLLNNFMPNGDRNIPLRELVSYTFTKGPNEINREDQRRIIQIFANIHERDYKSVLNDIRRVTASVEMPDQEYFISIAGEDMEMKRSFRSLLLALFVSIALVYMILAAQFESLLQPFVIMFAVPLALIGVISFLYVTSNSINIMSVIGTIILIGIVVNDAIVKVDFINNAHKGGLPLRKAIEEAGRKRLRPIIMTTVTTVLGLTPMALGIGKGANMQAPMAIAVIGGLLTATLLTLIIIPVIYSYVGGMKDVG